MIDPIEELIAEAVATEFEKSPAVHQVVINANGIAEAAVHALREAGLLRGPRGKISDPKFRHDRATHAAQAMHAQGKTNTAPAREAFNARFERQVDPEGIMSPTERAQQAEVARRQHFANLAKKSVAARSK